MSTIYPPIEQYRLLAETNNLIPVVREWTIDMETPISIFKRLEPESPCFLLESVEGGESLGRYSFMGFDPLWMLECKNGAGVVRTRAGEEAVSGHPLDILAGQVGRYRCPDLGLPRFFGGAVGYFGYDLVRYLERLPASAPDDLRLPDCSFMFPETVLIFDHVQHTLKAVVNSMVAENPDVSYERACARIHRLREKLDGQFPGHGGAPAPGNGEDQVVAETSPEEFKTAVRRAKEYIAAGEILQVVLSLRLRVPLRTAPFEVYRRLRVINPSPYLFYLDTGSTTVVGASPEMLVRVEGNAVRTRPIAGTRPRGAGRDDDLAYEEELKSDAKERAEHLMLVDLGRNDLARVCAPGSVRVPQFMTVERYSHVMHLTSEVQGTLEPGRTALEALGAVFPAGTVSGAPKVRAMEIIEELEPSRRGIYAGAVGYLGLTGTLDTCIAIRTAVIRDGQVYIQAGAGIVADSDPEREYQEVMHKASALIRAAQGGD
ncbi:anthranilate synthase component I [Candidatus Desulforudis audaxviator]|uniref:Anthranilate synthase component 1 n=1 Tax=Desulforudis audaxviator (strain MP104C) TaxID=477974 RepID=B1I400_DESAP|nr:anthranilate synthase component I [Candidatus Desulforudis audaxviator]ACA59702.1 anthranilate synthase component I [Candidatus Desulforudis audaxviator MP104C]AZK59695.1 Anthranilate synthase, aminase component [Candidatus Desulforudis audaxviator]